MLDALIGHPVAVLFAIVALGSALGNVRVARISLGSSGVLFVGLLFGHLGMAVPADIQELGIILFVYAIGLQAGPRFFNQFRQRGILFAKIGIIVVLAGACMTWILSGLLRIDAGLALGMYAGALTSTPGLAAAMDVARDPRVGVGFGIAYPLGVVAVVLLVQLLPRLPGVDLAGEERKLSRADSEGRHLQRRQFRVGNPACVGKTLVELQLHRMSEVNVTRVSRGGKVSPVRRETTLQRDDVVLAVGRREELDKLRILFGEEIEGEDIFNTTDVVARDVLVSNDAMVGKSLAELQVARTHGVVISRVFREDLDFVPTGGYVMELGDLIRATGSREECERFVQIVGQRERRIHETSIGALSLGIFLGVLLAYKEWSLPGGATFRLGLAGGPLFVSLALAHFGRIGRLNVRIPRGAKYILQQLGLVLFLAGAGTAAGGTLASVIIESGGVLLAAGAAVTLVSALVGFAVSRFLFRQDFLTVLGSVSGAMTSTPALGAAGEISGRSEAVLAYTGVYPVALIVITVVCQLLYFFL
jgi:putative transport protein